MESEESRRDDSLAHAAEAIRSNSAVTRKSGLQEAKTGLQDFLLLGGFKGSKRVSIQSLFDAIFRAAICERDAYIKTSSRNSTRAASSTAELCAVVLRTAVEATFAFIRKTTLIAIVDHVLQVVETPDGTFCGPLVADYIRALTLLLKYRPHADHLPVAQWTDAIQLCVRGAQHFGSSRHKSLKRSFATSQLTDSASDASIVSRSGSYSIANSTFIRTEFMNCLFYLTHVSNKPLLGKAEEVLTVSFDALKDTSHGSNVTLPALAIINDVLGRIVTSDLTTTWQALKNFLSVVHSVLQIKDHLVWDEMLSILMKLQPFLEKATGSAVGSSLLQAVEDLSNKMWLEYLKPPKQSSHRGHLHISQLRLDLVNETLDPDLPFQTPTIRLRRSSAWNECAWTTLYFIAFLNNWVDAHMVLLQDRHHLEDGEHPSKRAKLTTRLHNLVDQALGSTSVEERACSLHVLLFAIQQQTLPLEEVRSLISRLQKCISSREVEVSAWAFLCLSSLTFQEASQHSDLIPIWNETWQSALRQLYSATQNRVVCHCLCALIVNQCVNVDELEEELVSMLPFGSGSGLPYISDAALALSFITIDVLKARNPGMITKSYRLQWLSWLMARWAPGELDDRTHTHGVATSCPLEVIATILTSAASRSWAPITDHFRASELGFLGKQWQSQVRRNAALDYILLIDRPVNLTNLARKPVSGRVWQDTVKLFEGLINPSLVSLITREVEKTELFLSDSLESRPNFLTKDMFCVASGLCLVAETIAGKGDLHDGIAAAEFRARLESVNSLLYTAQLTVTDRKEMLQIFLENCQIINAPASWTNYNDSQLDAECHPVMTLNTLHKVYESFKAPRDGSSQQSSSLDDDFDIGLDSQNKSFRTKSEGGLTIIDPAESWVLSSYHTSTALYLDLVMVKTSQAKKGVSSSSSSLLELFISRLDHYEDAEIICAYDLLLYLLRIEWNRAAGCHGLSSLLDYLSDNMLSSYNFERSELPVLICINALKESMPHWTHTDDRELSNISADLFEWLVRLLSKTEFLSTRVQKGIASLLVAAIRDTPGGLPDGDCPPPEESLLHLLKHSGIWVQYMLAQEIPPLLRQRPSSSFAQLFESIREALPSNLDYSEGIAIRLLFLLQIGVSENSLVKRCCCYILETVEQSSDAAAHATWCLQKMAVELNLPSAKHIFRLFCSEIVRKWILSIETASARTLTSIPFQVFGYTNLKQLLVDGRDHFVAQLMSSGFKDLKVAFENESGLSCASVIAEGAFSRTMAYAYLRDAAHARTSSSQSLSSESFVRETVSSAQLNSLLVKHYPSIVGNILISIGQEDAIEEAFASNKIYASALRSFQLMDSPNGTIIQLHGSQPPSYKPRVCLAALEKLVRRINKDVVSIWSPTVILVTLRLLLEEARQSSNSRLSIWILTRLKILIALCGKKATEGYVLQRLLQIIRHSLFDHESRTTGLIILKYLLDAGKGSLEQDPSFVVSFGVAGLLSIRVLSTSNPSDGHTIETDMQLLQEARDCIIAYISTCASQLATDKPLLLKAIEDMSSESSMLGSFDMGNPQWTLLLELLADNQAPSRWIDRYSFLTCLHLLVHQFEAGDSLSSDMSCNSEDLQSIRGAIWEVCHLEGLNDRFRSWAAFFLGQQYRNNGLVPAMALKDASIGIFSQSGLQAEANSSSQARLFQLFLQLLTSDDIFLVGTAERALGHILSSKSDEVSAAALFPSPSISAALSGRLWELTSSTLQDHSLEQFDQVSKHYGLDGTWARKLVLLLAHRGRESVFLVALGLMADASDTLSEEFFPFAVHLCLLSRLNKEEDTRSEISRGFQSCFDNAGSVLERYLRILVSTVLYLRCQPYPGERTEADRSLWLEIDYSSAARVAVQCGMLKSSLLLAELSSSVTSTSLRRSIATISHQTPSDDLLMSIFARIEEPDAFYGVQKPHDLTTLAERFAYEQNGMETLLLRGLQSDVKLRLGDSQSDNGHDHVLDALSSLNLNGMTYQHFRNQGNLAPQSKSNSSMYKAALRLGKWDLHVAEEHRLPSVFGSIYNIFRSMNIDGGLDKVEKLIDRGSLSILDQMVTASYSGQDTVEAFAGLAALAEMKDVVTCHERGGDKTKILDRMQSSANWMGLANVSEVSAILITRETLSGALRSPSIAREPAVIDHASRLAFQANVTLLSSQICRDQHALEEALARVTFLSSLSARCLEVGRNIEDAVVFETARVLEQRDQTLPAIRMLSALVDGSDFSNQEIGCSKAQVLATLGRQSANARLEKSGDIIQKYLVTALAELSTTDNARQIGSVHREYASYCHSQLESPEFTSEFNRSEAFRDRKQAELRELGRIIAASKDTQQVQQAKFDRKKAKMWLDIDHNEYERLQKDRQTFLEMSLEHYLISLAASDENNVDVLRFLNIWLANNQDDGANRVVAGAIDQVPSRKFVPVLNQLTARLQDSTDPFQQSLWKLVKRICIDHPYHGINHIFAGSSTVGSGNGDKSASSRSAAATSIAHDLCSTERTREICRSIFKANTCYVELARMQSPEQGEQKRTLKMHSYKATQKTEKYVPALKVPPITMKIEVRDDCDYTQVPVVTSFDADFAVASGLSAPKVVTAVASNGVRYKQLYKAGNDDLRQDAIMEQVFEEATGVLSRNRATRQRRLLIRTYKVMPLTATSGVIEFVPNSIVFHDWLKPAHTRYHPKDLSWSTCRQRIGDASKSPQTTRIKVFEQICSRFQPVLRHFFFEHFKDPSDWFDKRLSYTRSTAAISMLGHALGLGDRHCQNIMLDSQTGEVIHIDLGVAFEAGRILSVPEVVPFRLTRDVVDGFGIMKTEGVFRRCCEFTLDALRENKGVVMTLLNVLRYDPLHNWSVSPLRARRLREEQERDMAAAADSAATFTTTSRSRRSMALDERQLNAAEDKGIAKDAADEGGEADRALAVVEKKLSKGLSVQATVNELIQQASDERNLALLFYGWAAFA